MKTIEEEFLEGRKPEEFINGSYVELKTERRNLLNLARLVDKKLEEIKRLSK